MAPIDDRVKLSDRSGLAGAALLDRECLQTMQQHHLGLEAGAVLLDERDEIGLYHRPTAFGNVASAAIVLHASRSGVRSLLASSMAVTSCFSVTSSSRAVR